MKFAVDIEESNIYAASDNQNVYAYPLEMSQDPNQQAAGKAK